MNRLLVILSLSLLCTGLGLWAKEPSPVMVEQAQASENSGSFEYQGSITSRWRATLSAQVEGLVAMADVESGYGARQGEELVHLDSTLAEIELRQAQASLATARSEQEDAQRLLQEIEELADSAITRSERQSRITTVKLAENTVAYEEAEVALREERVRRHQVRAPFDGVLIRRLVEVGEWVQPGDALVEMVNTADLRLDIQVPQEEVEVLSQVDEVLVHVAGLKQAISGELLSISPAVDARTRTFMVRIRLQNAPDTVKPGMSARAVFRPEQDDSQLWISRDAIVRLSDGRIQVWVVESGDARSRQVILGRTVGDRIEVLSGLQGDEQIVVRGNESLREGQPVRILASELAEGGGN